MKCPCSMLLIGINLHSERECGGWGSASGPVELWIHLHIHAPNWGYHIKNEDHEYHELISESGYDKEDHLMNVKYLDRQMHNNGCATEVQI